MRQMLHRVNPVLSWTGWLNVLLAGLALALLPLDQRLVTGMLVWVKPLKFDVSIAVVLVTAGVFLEGLQGWDAAKLSAGTALAVALGIEGVLISLQAARGVRSHLNISTPFDAHVSMVMGLMAVFYLGDFWQVSPPATGLVAVVGAVYILGAMFYALKRPHLSPRYFGFHELFHVCTIIGFTLHYIAVVFAISS